MNARTVVIIVVAAALVAATSAYAAVKPKPWQWTTAQAASALILWDPSVFPSRERMEAVNKARCTGRGKAVQGRFVAFRCVTGFGQRTGNVAKTAVLWVRVRKVGRGQPCVSLTSLAAIPAECLDPTGAPRVAGDPYLGLRKAMTIRMGTGGLWSSAIECIGYGAGFYTCTFDNPAERGAALLTLTSKGAVVKVTAIECLLQTDRPGCSPD